MAVSRVHNRISMKFYKSEREDTMEKRKKKNGIEWRKEDSLSFPSYVLFKCVFSMPYTMERYSEVLACK